MRVTPVVYITTDTMSSTCFKNKPCRNLHLPWILASQEPQRDQAGRLQDTAERKHWGFSTRCLPSFRCSRRCMIVNLPEVHRSDHEGYREDPDRRRNNKKEMKVWTHSWVDSFSSSHNVGSTGWQHTTVFSDNCTYWWAIRARRSGKSWKTLSPLRNRNIFSVDCTKVRAVVQRLG